MNDRCMSIYLLYSCHRSAPTCAPLFFFASRKSASLLSAVWFQWMKGCFIYLFSFLVMEKDVLVPQGFQSVICSCFGPPPHGLSQSLCGFGLKVYLASLFWSLVGSFVFMYTVSFIRENYHDHYLLTFLLIIIKHQLCNTVVWKMWLNISVIVL